VTDTVQLLGTVDVNCKLKITGRPCSVTVVVVCLLIQRPTLVASKDVRTKRNSVGEILEYLNVNVPARISVSSVSGSLYACQERHPGLGGAGAGAWAGRSIGTTATASASRPSRQSAHYNFTARHLHRNGATRCRTVDTTNGVIVKAERWAEVKCVIDALRLALARAGAHELACGSVPHFFQGSILAQCDS